MSMQSTWEEHMANLLLQEEPDVPRSFKFEFYNSGRDMRALKNPLIRIIM